MAVSGDYGGSLFAEFYDIVHAGLSDVEAYLGFASECGPRILEFDAVRAGYLYPWQTSAFRLPELTPLSHAGRPAVANWSGEIARLRAECA